MESEKNKITRQIGISLAIIGILFLTIAILNLSKNWRDNHILLMYGFMIFMVFNLFKLSKSGNVDMNNTIENLNKLPKGLRKTKFHTRYVESRQYGIWNKWKNGLYK